MSSAGCPGATVHSLEAPSWLSRDRSKVRQRTDRTLFAVLPCIRGSEPAAAGRHYGEKTMDLLIIVIVLLVLFGGGGGVYWGMGGGWGIGPIGLIVAVLVIAFLLNGYRGRRGR
jgi:hypothetical protein